MSQNQPGVIKTSAKIATYNAAASAGVIVGIFGGLAVAGTILDKLKSKKNK